MKEVDTTIPYYVVIAVVTLCASVCRYKGVVILLTIFIWNVNAGLRNVIPFFSISATLNSIRSDISVHSGNALYAGVGS